MDVWILELRPGVRGDSACPAWLATLVIFRTLKLSFIFKYSWSFLYTMPRNPYRFIYSSTYYTVSNYYLTDRPKSVRNRCLIEHFCGVVCVVTLPFWHFCWCRGFCHRTESDLFLFLSLALDNLSEFELVTIVIIGYMLRYHTENSDSISWYGTRNKLSKKR